MSSINYINAGYNELVKHVRASNVRRKRAKVGVTYRAMMEEEEIKTNEISKIFLQGKIIKGDTREGSSAASSRRRVFRTERRRSKDYGSKLAKSMERDSFFGRSPTSSPSFSPPTNTKTVHNNNSKNESSQHVNKFLEKVTVKEVPLYWLTEAGPHKPRVRPRSAGVRNARLKHRNHIQNKSYAKGDLLQDLEQFKYIIDRDENRKKQMLKKSPNKKNNVKKKMAISIPIDYNKRRQKYERNKKENFDKQTQKKKMEKDESRKTVGENIRRLKGASSVNLAADIPKKNINNRPTRPHTARIHGRHNRKIIQKKKHRGVINQPEDDSNNRSYIRRPKSARTSTRGTAKWGMQSELGKIAIIKLKNQFRRQQGQLGNQLERYLERRRLEREQNLNVRARSDSILNPSVKVEINTIHNIQRRQSSVSEFKLKTRLNNHGIFRIICQAVKKSTKGFPKEGILQSIKNMGGILQRDLPTMLRGLTNGERILLELLKRLIVQDIMITEDVIYGMLDQLNAKTDLPNIHLVPTIQTLFRCFIMNNNNNNNNQDSDQDMDDGKVDVISIEDFLIRLQNHNELKRNTKLYDKIVNLYRLPHNEAILKSQAATRETFRVNRLSKMGYSTLKPELRQRRGGKLSINNQLGKVI